MDLQTKDEDVCTDHDQPEGVKPTRKRQFKTSSVKKKLADIKYKYMCSLRKERKLQFPPGRGSRVVYLNMFDKLMLPSVTLTKVSALNSALDGEHPSLDKQQESLSFEESSQKENHTVFFKKSSPKYGGHSPVDRNNRGKRRKNKVKYVETIPKSILNDMCPEQSVIDKSAQLLDDSNNIKRKHDTLIESSIPIKKRFVQKGKPLEKVNNTTNKRGILDAVSNKNTNHGTKSHGDHIVSPLSPVNSPRKQSRDSMPGLQGNMSPSNHSDANRLGSFHSQADVDAVLTPPSSDTMQVDKNVVTKTAQKKEHLPCLNGDLSKLEYLTNNISQRIFSAANDGYEKSFPKMEIMTSKLSHEMSEDRQHKHFGSDKAEIVHNHMTSTCQPIIQSQIPLLSTLHSAKEHSTNHDTKLYNVFSKGLTESDILSQTMHTSQSKVECGDDSDSDTVPYADNAPITDVQQEKQFQHMLSSNPLFESTEQSINEQSSTKKRRRRKRQGIMRRLNRPSRQNQIESKNNSLSDQSKLIATGETMDNKQQDPNKIVKSIMSSLLDNVGKGKPKGKRRRRTKNPAVEQRQRMKRECTSAVKRKERSSGPVKTRGRKPKTVRRKSGGENNSEIKDAWDLDAEGKYETGDILKSDTTSTNVNDNNPYEGLVLCSGTHRTFYRKPQGKRKSRKKRRYTVLRRRKSDKKDSPEHNEMNINDSTDTNENNLNQTVCDTNTCNISNTVQETSIETPIELLDSDESNENKQYSTDTFSNNNSIRNNDFQITKTQENHEKIDFKSQTEKHTLCDSSSKHTSPSEQSVCHPLEPTPNNQQQSQQCDGSHTDNRLSMEFSKHNWILEKYKDLLNVNENVKDMKHNNAPTLIDAPNANTNNYDPKTAIHVREPCHVREIGQTPKMKIKRLQASRMIEMANLSKPASPIECPLKSNDKALNARPTTAVPMTGKGANMAQKLSDMESNTSSRPSLADARVSNRNTSQTVSTPNKPDTPKTVTPIKTKAAYKQLQPGFHLAREMYKPPVQTQANDSLSSRSSSTASLKEYIKPAGPTHSQSHDDNHSFCNEAHNTLHEHRTDVDDSMSIPERLDTPNKRKSPFSLWRPSDIMDRGTKESLEKHDTFPLDLRIGTKLSSRLQSERHLNGKQSFSRSFDTSRDHSEANQQPGSRQHFSSSVPPHEEYIDDLTENQRRRSFSVPDNSDSRYKGTVLRHGFHIDSYLFQSADIRKCISRNDQPKCPSPVTDVRTKSDIEQARSMKVTQHSNERVFYDQQSRGTRPPAPTATSISSSSSSSPDLDYKRQSTSQLSACSDLAAVPNIIQAMTTQFPPVMTMPADVSAYKNKSTHNSSHHPEARPASQMHSSSYTRDVDSESYNNHRIPNKITNFNDRRPAQRDTKPLPPSSSSPAVNKSWSDRSYDRVGNATHQNSHNMPNTVYHEKPEQTNNHIVHSCPKPINPLNGPIEPSVVSYPRSSYPENGPALPRSPKMHSAVERLKETALLQQRASLYFPHWAPVRSRTLSNLDEDPAMNNKLYLPLENELPKASMSVPATSGPAVERSAHPATRSALTPPISHFNCEVCGRQAMFLCSGCKKVGYCTFECQMFSWKTHKNDCVLEIRNPFDN